ncbi:MAG: PspA/IM30 family protein [Gemmatimonadota bacterium]|nr:PspA/IM30 family protein [Gemmatimonadota bacterium]
MAAGAFSRFANIIRADVDDLLNRMEDPEKMSRLMMTEMENAVNDAVAAVADAIAGRRLLERRLKARREDAATWNRTAERSVSQGDNDLARLALERKAEVEAEAGEIETALAEAAKVADRLERQCARLKTRLNEARARRRSLVARTRVAIGYDSGAVSDVRIREEAFERFDALCRKVDHEEAAAEVYEEMAGNATDADERLEEMARKERVDARLRELKEKLADEQDGREA